MYTKYGFLSTYDYFNLRIFGLMTGMRNVSGR